MKLYYTPGACSLSPHIVLREAGVPFTLTRVDLATKTTESGANYLEITRRGRVPALQLPTGEVLTEGAAIVQYIADTHPAANLAPPPGTLERARMQEALNFLASEAHKSFSPLFSPVASDAMKEAAVANVARAMGELDGILGDGRPWAAGDAYSVADAYLFTVASWAAPKKIDLERWPNVAALVRRIGERPAVREALRAEGLG